MNRPHITKQIADQVHQVAPDVQLILYGSEARGDARLDSDIDILVLFDKDSISIQDKDLIGIPLYNIELSTNTPINPIYYTKKAWQDRPMDYFKMNIQQEGVNL